MNIDPHLHHPELARWKIARENTPVFNGNRRFLSLISHMDMRQMMMLVISIKNGNQNSLEHRNNRHHTSFSYSARLLQF